MLHLHDDSHSVLVGKLELELDADYELLNHTILTMGFSFHGSALADSTTADQKYI